MRTKLKIGEIIAEFYDYLAVRGLIELYQEKWRLIELYQEKWRLIELYQEKWRAYEG